MDYWKILRSALGSQQLIFPAAVGAMVQDGKILLVRNTAGMWGLPGGLQELNESISDTVVRELREELGVPFEIDCLVGVYSEPRFIFDFENGDRVQLVLFLFRMKHTVECSFTLQEEEVKDVRYFSLHDLPENLFPECREQIGDLMQFTGSVVVK